MEENQRRAMVEEVIQMFRDLDKAIRHLLEAETIIEAEARRASGDDREILCEATDILDGVKDMLEQMT